MSEPAKISDADAIALAVSGAPVEPYARSNSHALHDHKGLPAIARGFIALNMGNATETMAIEEAGFMPALYGRKDGKACRVIMVSSLGDVGITFKNNRYGYAERCSIYDLDAAAFTLEKPADLPEPPPEPKSYDDRAIEFRSFVTREPRRRNAKIRTRP